MLIFLYIFIAVLPATLSKKTYQLTFPETYKYSYARLFGTIDHPLVDFTLCHWSRINVSKGWGAVFSYNNDTKDDLILTLSVDSSSVVFYANPHTTGTVETSAQISDWVHACFTRTTVEGKWNIFINGVSKSSGKFLENTSPIPPNGDVILGQNQDIKFENKAFNFAGVHDFKGQITEVHLWDYILTPYEISKVFTCTFPEEGNVIGWNHRTWELHNGVLISMVELPCDHS